MAFGEKLFPRPAISATRFCLWAVLCFFPFLPLGRPYLLLETLLYLRKLLQQMTLHQPLLREPLQPLLLDVLRSFRLDGLPLD